MTRYIVRENDSQLNLNSQSSLTLIFISNILQRSFTGACSPSIKGLVTPLAVKLVKFCCYFTGKKLSVVYCVAMYKAQKSFSSSFLLMKQNLHRGNLSALHEVPDCMYSYYNFMQNHEFFHRALHGAFWD